MCTTFTEHVRTFGPDCDLAACVLPRLEQVLRRQMRRRQLLTAPPAYLGYPEVASWQTPGAFDDLLSDCYLYAVVRRVQGLRNQLAARADIDPMIWVNVRNFLFERQRRNDPIGYATFGNVEGAVGELEAAGGCVAEDRTGGRLTGQSLIHLRPGEPLGDVADAAAVANIIREVPGLSAVLSHLTSTSEVGRVWAVECLKTLDERGGVRVRVADVVAAIAERVRGEWAAWNGGAADEMASEDGPDEVSRLVRVVRPDSTADRDQWDRLKRTVPERIAGLDDAAVRGRLAAQFAALVSCIEAGGEPSQADLTRELGVPRSTLSRDFARLREIVEEILRTDGTPAPGGG